MPIYEYECKNCNTRFEKLQSITAEPLTECVNCGGGPIRRVLHPVGIIFKGSGWYVNDSRKPEKSGENASSNGASSGSSGAPSSEPAKTETPKESKAEKPASGSSSE